MAYDDTEREDAGLLDKSNYSRFEGEERSPSKLQRHGYLNLHVLAILLVLLAASVAANMVLAVQLEQERVLSKTCKSPFSGLRPDHAIDFGVKSAWGDSSNMTALDELWYGMDVNAGMVQLPKEKNLGSTQDFPWDTTKGIYILNSYHNLHCLQVIYSFIRDYQEDRPREETMGHVAHCLQDLREDVMCSADDTLVALPSDEQLRSPQQLALPPKRMCRSFDQLRDYAMENSACLRRFARGHPLRDSLVEFMNCPETSPYFEFVEGLKDGYSNFDEYVAKGEF